MKYSIFNRVLQDIDNKKPKIISILGVYNSPFTIRS